MHAHTIYVPMKYLLMTSAVAFSRSICDIWPIFSASVIRRSRSSIRVLSGWDGSLYLAPPPPDFMGNAAAQPHSCSSNRQAAAAAMATATLLPPPPPPGTPIAQLDQLVAVSIPSYL